MLTMRTDVEGSHLKHAGWNKPTIRKEKIDEKWSSNLRHGGNGVGACTSHGRDRDSGSADGFVRFLLAGQVTGRTCSRTSA
jgi:hypothetical protein